MSDNLDSGEEEIPQDWQWCCPCGMLVKGDVLCPTCFSYPPWRSQKEERFENFDRFDPYEVDLEDFDYTGGE